MIAAVLLVLGFMLSSTATNAGDPLDQFCGISSNNNTTKSTELLSHMLVKNASANPSPFAKGSISAVSGTIYGLFLCRGDVGAFDCSQCATIGFQDAQRLCEFTKEATIFYDQCLIRFSNKDFLDHVSPLVRDYIVVRTTSDALPGLLDPNRPNSVTFINDIIKVLLQETAKQAAYNSTWRFATGRMDVNGNFAPLYSLMQCLPDLTPTDCWECLKNISEMAMSRQGNQVLTVPCNLRYGMVQFYEGRPMWRIVIPSADAVVPPDHVMPTNQKHKRSMSKVLVTALIVPPLASIFCFLYFIYSRKHRKGSQKRVKMKVKEDEALDWGLEGRSSEFTVYDFSQVLEATCHFSEENKLGQGGFGPVYKGRFPDGMEIAVKRLASHSGQGFTEFKNEIQLIAKLQHTNLVRLLGCCYQGQEKLLIYEYLPNKSLDFFIFDETRRALVDWNKRLVIIDGIAQGLLYLHKHSRLRVIHRDLKASNILLDHEMNPKISDFGLAKIFSKNDTEQNTKRIVGTYGYMAPEYASEGLFSVKSDVFSFGVLILEIISGQRTSRFHRYGDFINLLGHAWQLWKEERWLQLVDASIAEYRTPGMMRCINIALLCVQENAANRPTMSDVVAMLSSENVTLPEPKHPAYFHVRVTEEEESTLVEPCSLNDVTISAHDMDGFISMN
ncbi:cysteine-rich receptor-like protein kinase 10 isoform X2 [Panicum hallii]|uniref:cysteine-rich receptor-like protein kinase 10 isoform X2 n=1 Tax=Panicum hallii TaxID=206008 RepID=UPI000DF4DA03|nr:cysteine-rich receptor-like protein kinase 10 isoform X2 [Panicum hallii]